MKALKPSIYLLLFIYVMGALASTRTQAGARTLEDPGKALLRRHLETLGGTPPYRPFDTDALLRAASHSASGEAHPSLATLDEIGETAGVSASEILAWKTQGMEEVKFRLRKRHLIAFALTGSPRLEAARQTFEATGNRYGQLTFLQDFAAAYQGLSNRLMLGPGTSPPMMESLSANEWPMNMRTLLGKVVDAHERVASQNYLMVARDLAFRISEIFSSLQNTVQTELLIQEQIDLIRQLKENAKNRYAQGLGAYSDVNMWQVEEGEKQAMAADLSQKKKALLTGLSEELGFKDIHLDKLDLDADLEPPRLQVMLSQLQKHAEAKNQELEIMRQKIQAMDWMIQMNRQEGALSFTTTLSYTGTEGEFERSPAPPSAAEIDEAVLRLDYTQELEAQKQAMVFELKSEIRMTRKRVSEVYFRWKSAMAALELQQKTIQPRAREIMEAARIAYGTGTGSYAEWLEAQKNIFEKKFDVEKSRSDAWNALHELFMDIGSFHGLQGGGNLE